MIFSTYMFIFVFLPTVFFVYRLLNVLKLYTPAKLWLVFASFYFYAQGSPDFILMFIGTVFFNYLIGYLILRARSRIIKRILLTIGLIENIVLLGYYKYANFVIENYIFVTGHAVTLLDIVLPIGISFFTFQLIAYIVDCYRGNTSRHSIVNFLLFITFFPQLIVGPIVHHKDVVPQFMDEKQPFFNKFYFSLGIFIFSIGCAKKILLADPLTAFAVEYYADIYAADVTTAWVAVVCYTISYYFDLSGYADMAIGLGLLFNIKLPQNFNSPYKARNFKEYWQRWHITLSRFLSDYVFRTFFKKGDGSFKFYYAVMMTFLVSGFWHGAGWSFVVWGVVNGILVCIAHFMTRHKIALPFLLAWTLCFAGAIGTRILFVAEDLNQAISVMKMLFDFQLFSGLALHEIYSILITFVAYNLYTLIILAIGMGISFFAKNTTQIVENFKPNFKYAVWAAFLLALALFQMTNVSDFLYFQF